MPYIAQKNRVQYRAVLDELLPKLTLDKPGDVVYVFYAIIVRLWRREKKFSKINAIRGIIWSVLTEFDRVEAGWYEACKLEENGDVE